MNRRQRAFFMSAVFLAMGAAGIVITGLATFFGKEAALACCVAAWLFFVLATVVLP